MAGWALCMTLVLVALPGSVSCQTYQDFLRKHVDYPQSPVNPPQRYCDIMVQRQNITIRGPPCKHLNTFVHASGQVVMNACYQRPDRQGRYTTPIRLEITGCDLQQGSTWPTCQYQTQQALRFVVVNCNANRLPTHLDSTCT